MTTKLLTERQPMMAKRKKKPPLRAGVKLWLAALRSGKYKQGSGRLGNAERGYCCLGVACEVYKQNVNRRFRYSSVALNLSRYDKVMDWLGLRSSLGDYSGGEASCLSALNDGGRNFEEIADLIESQPPGLFGGSGSAR